MSNSKCILDLEETIEGFGEIYKAKAPFYRAYKILSSINAEIISARDLQYARMQVKDGLENSLSKLGSVIREGVVYLFNRGIILLKSPPILQSLSIAKEATHSHKVWQDFAIDEKLAGEYWEKAHDSKNTDALILKDRRPIPTNKFGEDERPLWLFEDKAKDIGDFLHDKNIKEFSLFFDSEDHINKHSMSYANQLWLLLVGTKTGAAGYFEHLDSPDCLVRGLIRKNF